MTDYKYYRVAKDCGKAAPGDLGHRREHDFKAGEVLTLIEMTGRDGRVSYWTSSDIDFAFIFLPTEVFEISKAEYDSMRKVKK